MGNCIRMEDAEEEDICIIGWDVACSSIVSRCSQNSTVLHAVLHGGDAMNGHLSLPRRQEAVFQ